MIRTTHIAALCLMAVGWAACSSENEEQPANDTWILNVKATKAETRATRALNFDGTNLAATWNTGETVDVRTGYELISRGTLYAQSDGSSVDLKGPITGTDFSTESTLSLWFPRYKGDNTYTGQKGTIADIAAHFDYAHASVRVMTVDQDKHVLTTEEATFQNVQAIVKFTLKYNTSPLSVSTLFVYQGSEYGENKLASATLASGSSEVWLAIPPVTDKTIIIIATSGDNTYTYTKSSVTFSAGHFYPINVSMGHR